MRQAKGYAVYWRNPETRKFEALPNAKVWTSTIDGEFGPRTIAGTPQPHIKSKIPDLKMIDLDLSKAWWE